MHCIMNLFILLFNLLITTKCSIHYKSYHFEWNNRDEWSLNNNLIQYDSEIISCTINIPSLCIYAIPTKPGFQVFYKHLMFDFLNDQNWTQIIVTNNFDIDHGLIDDTHIDIDIDIDIDIKHNQQYNINDEETDDEQHDDDDDKKQILETPQRRRLRSSRRIPIYRYWKGSAADHFYTQSRTEIGKTQKGRVGRYGYKSEGTAFYLAQRRGAGMVPLYRYWKSGISDHFYTTNSREIGTTRRGKRGRYGYKYEGILGYCYQRRRSGTVPLYRYWKGGRRGDHFYTTNRNEIGTTQKGRKGRYGYKSEGVTCYVYNRPYRQNRRHRRHRRHRRPHRRHRRHRWRGRHYRARLRAALRRARLRSRRRARERKQRQRVYQSLYRFGRMLGRSMRTGNYKGLCGLAGTCGGGCGNPMRGRCPPRFATYLGPPHIVGRPSYILGSPPVGHAPSGYGRSKPFGMGLGVSPIYPGMMGGYHGVMGGLWPGMYHGVNGNPQQMVQHGLMVGGPHIVGAAAVAGNNKRRMIEGDRNGYDDKNVNGVILRKCRLIKDEEVVICATYYYYDGSVVLDYNIVVDENENDEDKIGMFGDDEERDDQLVEYIKSSIWIWKEDERNLIQCDENLLSFIGYTVCMEQRDDDEIFVLIIEHMNDAPIDELSLMKQEEWDKIYEFNDTENHKKICQYISMIEICFESKSDHKNIQITTQRVLPDDA